MTAALRIRRLQQPPELSWAVWRADRPEVVVHATMSESQFVRLKGSEAIRQGVLEVLQAAAQKVEATIAELDEL